MPMILINPLVQFKRRNCQSESEDGADEEGEYEGKRVC